MSRQSEIRERLERVVGAYPDSDDVRYLLDRLEAAEGLLERTAKWMRCIAPAADELIAELRYALAFILTSCESIAGARITARKALGISEEQDRRNRKDASRAVDVALSRAAEYRKGAKKL